MAECRKIHEHICGSRKQNQEIWFLTEGDDGEAVVLRKRLCRGKGEKQFRLVEERRMSVGEAMSEGGKLAKNLWYALPN